MVERCVTNRPQEVNVQTSLNGFIRNNAVCYCFYFAWCTSQLFNKINNKVGLTLNWVLYILHANGQMTHSVKVMWMRLRGWWLVTGPGFGPSVGGLGFLASRCSNFSAQNFPELSRLYQNHRFLEHYLTALVVSLVDKLTIRVNFQSVIKVLMKRIQFESTLWGINTFLKK